MSARITASLFGAALALVAAAVASSLYTSQAAFAQTPQNPEACARLRGELNDMTVRLMRNGHTFAEAQDATMRELEMRRLTGDPCFMPPPPPPPRPAVPLPNDLDRWIPPSPPPLKGLPQLR